MARRLLLLVLLMVLAGCGGGSGVEPVGGNGPDGQGPLVLDPGTIIKGQGVSLGVLKDASGVPQGVRVSWTRVNVAGVQGYYIYRDDETIPPGNPAGHSDKRVNGGSMVPQSGTGTDTLNFDDLFTPPVGSTWFYRMTVVNSTSDESDFSNEQSISIAAHTIDTITTTAVGIGEQVTITGDNFGATRGTDKVFFSDSGASVDVEAASYVSWNNTQIVVTVPYGAADGVLGVTVGGSSVLSSQSIAYREPAITSITPNSDWVGNLFVTIAGTDFGPAPASGGTDTDVFFGTTAALDADIDDAQWSTTQIKVRVPAAAVGMTVAVHVDLAGNLSNNSNFLILPHINSLSPQQASTGTSVSISGTNFGATQSSGSISFSGVAASVTSWNNTTIAANVPAAAVDGNVVVTRSDTNVTNGMGFDVVPTITTIGPGRRVVGQSLTIDGSGFGSSRGSSTVVFNGGGVSAVTYSTWTNNQIVVVVPTGATSGTVTVNLVDADIAGVDDDDSATSSSNVTVVLAAPVITDVGQV